MTGRSCGGTGHSEPGGSPGPDGAVGSAWVTARGSADKQCSALALAPPSRPLGAAPGPAPANTAPARTPVQTSARRPGKRPLCARLGTGAPASPSAAAPAWPLFPRARHPRRPAPGQTTRIHGGGAPAAVEAGGAAAARVVGCAPGTSRTNSSGSASQSSLAGGFGASWPLRPAVALPRCPLRGFVGHEGSEPGPAVPRGSPSRADRPGSAYQAVQPPAPGRERPAGRATAPRHAASTPDRHLWLGAWDRPENRASGPLGWAVCCVSSAEPGQGGGFPGGVATAACGPAGRAVGATGVAPASSASRLGRCLLDE